MGRLTSLIFSIGYQILEIQFFQNGSKNVRNVIQIILKCSYFPQKKLQKIAQRPAPRPQSVIGLG